MRKNLKFRRQIISFRLKRTFFRHSSKMRIFFMSMLIPACLTRANLVTLTDQNFDSVVQENPTFVKFCSPNCHHCQRAAPVWEKLADAAPSYPQSFVVGDVDCTSETSLCDRFGIRGVPTLIYFREGRMYKYAGNREYNDLLKFGAGDYTLAQESSDIPSAAGGGLVNTAKYSMVKFLKDLHAILRFNQWVALFILSIGFIAGILVSFLFMVATMPKYHNERQFSEIQELATERETSEPKSSEAKKDD